MNNTLCMFGDSVGRGIVFDSVAGRYHLLKDNFARLLSKSIGIELKNYSCFGCTVTKGAKVVEKHEAALLDRGGVILEFGGNDCDFNWTQVAEQPEAAHVCGTPMPDFKRIYRELIEKVRNAGSTPFLMTLPPIDPDRYFEYISRGLSKKSIMQFLGDTDRIYRWHEYYSLAVSSLAAETGAKLIDVRSAFLERRNCFEMICADGIHPNGKGHAFISDVVGKMAFA